MDYLKATIYFKDKIVHEAFYKLLAGAEVGIFKGPYVSLKLPLVKATDDEIIPLRIARYKCLN